MGRKLTYTRAEVRRLIRRAEREREGSQCRKEAFDDARAAIAVYFRETGTFVTMRRF